MLVRRKPSEPAPARRRRRRIRKLRLLALLGVLGLLTITAFSYGLILAVGQQLQGLDPLRQQRQQVDGYLYAADGHTILDVLRGDQSRVLVPSEAISPLMKQAIVATEDRRFYEHRGIDLRGMGRALWADVRHKAAVQGGSTITQQFVKNQLTGGGRTVTRKLKEAALAWQLEQHWSKDKILTDYLNTIYFGNGAYGVERAARTYFGHSARKLTAAEAALLAGIPEDPSLYDPVTHPRIAAARRLTVLRLMLEQRVIAAADFRRDARAPMPRPEDVHLSGVQGQAPYFGEYVKQQLVDSKKLGGKRVLGSGFRVYTTIDLQLQKLAYKAVQKWLPSPDGPQAALVAINPRTGAVLAMYGGASFHHSQFNLAVQGERQAGSSFKPFVLATALRQGIAPQTTFVSEPISIFLGNRYWTPHNYEGEYLGPIDLTTATAVSDNSVFAQLTKLVGPANVAATAHAAGITSRLHGYFAIGLGAEPVNPLEMARAFATFANGGIRVDGAAFGDEPRAVTKIENVKGDVAYANRPTGKRVLPPVADEVLTQLLEGVVTSGTGKAAALPDRPVAGKTGTTENYGDAWFVGYTPQLVTAVWVGYPKEVRPMLAEFHGGPVAGGTFPALIWKTFMQSALAALHDPPQQFPAPPSLSVAPRRVTYRDGRLELDNGLCHQTSLVDYFAGRGPAKTAGCKPNEVAVPNVVGRELADARSRLAAQPLTPALIYKPASAGQRVDVVLRQFPATGTLSSFDKVTLVLAKPLHGLVPRVAGLSVPDARARLARLKLRAVVRPGHGTPGRVVAQRPAAGVAAAPGMAVRLVVGRS
ncbi:MAG: penicillin-binding protein [Actinomycetota bacterium]